MKRAIPVGRLAVSVGFIVIVVGLGGLGLSQVAKRQWRTQPTFRVGALFPSIGGLEVGHRARIQGIDAGLVEQVIPPQVPGGPVEVVLRLDDRLRGLVRVDARAKIVAEGLVGAKVVEIVPGRPDASMLDGDARIAAEPVTLPSDLLARAQGVIERVEKAAAAAERGLEETTALVQSIREGKGTLGKLARDDELYDRLTMVARRGDRALGALDDNLSALKETWPLSRYFDRRAYLDRERLLYRPNATRASQTLPADALFESDHALLTVAGKKRLDETARWFKGVARPSSDVVIAAFTDDHARDDQDLGEILTQAQADAIRDYLVAKHAIASVGWFRGRKVAAVGFGSHIPRAAPTPAPDTPPRHVEIIVFTPST